MRLTDRFKRYLGNELRKITPVIGKSIVFRGRNQHRYNHITFGLGNSTNYRGFLGIDADNSLEIFADEEYAEWIHNGFKSWEKDPFITNAINNDRLKTQKEIHSAVRKALQTAIREGFFK